MREIYATKTRNFTKGLLKTTEITILILFRQSLMKSAKKLYMLHTLFIKHLEPDYLKRYMKRVFVFWWQ